MRQQNSPPNGVPSNVTLLGNSEEIRLEFGDFYLVVYLVGLPGIGLSVTIYSSIVAVRRCPKSFNYLGYRIISIRDFFYSFNFGLFCVSHAGHKLLRKSYILTLLGFCKTLGRPLGSTLGESSLKRLFSIV